MNILALETSGKSGSVALLCDDRLVAEAALDPAQRSAQSLAPAIQAILARQGWSPRQVELVAVAIGPGSFTGLRIGVMTAKAFAYATAAAVIGINTLEVVASQAPRSAEPLEVVWDAQRHQLYTQTFALDAQGRPRPTSEVQIKDRAGWLSARRDVGRDPLRVSGPVLESLLAELPDPRVAIDRRCWHPTASAVGRLAAAKWQLGQRDDLWKLAPRYYRLSAAEEKANSSCRDCPTGK